ncbi:ankyrin [Jackrogersella minutella]|nr:ankyrin [Jackrogersella minutella]
MNSASPTTSASTNRGGRPKDWTEPRARRLIRLYIYTRLPFEQILKLLEDGVWKPGYDAANKVKNSLLGNDPRWIRPKDEEDEKRRIMALRNSRRGVKRDQRVSAEHSTRGKCNTCVPRCHDDDSLTLVQSSHPSLEKFNTAFHFNQEMLDPMNQVGSNVPNTDCGSHDAYPYSSWVPVNGMNNYRQGTGLTSSTDTSTSSSFREKLFDTISQDQAKGAWRVLKQFTFPKDRDLQRGISLSPVCSPGSQLHPTHKGFHNLDGSALHVSSNAQYAVPGDFLNADLFTGKSLCNINSSSHETCWCRIVDNLIPVQAIWPIDRNYLSIQDIFSNDVYQRIDDFGNTIFHRLATMDGDRMSFLTLIAQALGHPQLPVDAKNTAGQTFLHVLHQSWFDEEVLLEQLLTTLKDAKFDILATDIYGRSFFHLLQIKKQDSARIPGHLFDQEVPSQRDAFGVKPMESRVRHLEPTTAQIQRRASPMNVRNSGRAAIPPMIIDIPSDRGNESRIRPQTELLRIVIDVIKVDGVSLTCPDPQLEDSRGRNALHCLAEVELDVDRVQDPVHDNPRQRKRKFKEEDRESRHDSSRNGQRLEFLEGILSAGVDVNHYDCQGQTPLMAFIKYRPEDSRSDRDIMEGTIRRLHQRGAILDKRNRQGETALHVAARSGKKVALKELLQLGANPYVRDACGLSVLAAIDELWANAEGDGILIARLEACRGIFTSLVQTSAQEPTVLQEWGVRQQPAEPSRLAANC